MRTAKSPASKEVDRRSCALRNGHADAREGEIDMQLGEIAKTKPGVAIGSYPFFDPQHGPNTNVVLRARDAPKLAQAERERTCWSE
jgi:hypothetical protein